MRFLILAAVLATVAVALIASSLGSDSEPAEQRAPEPAREPLGRLRSSGGYTLTAQPPLIRAGRPTALSLAILDSRGRPARDLEVTHTKRLHLIVVRRDLTRFQHLHPRVDERGVWHQRLLLPDPGPYRVFADFKAGGKQRALSTPVGAPGPYRAEAGPPPGRTAAADGGYTVTRSGADGRQVFRVFRDGRPVADLQGYLGARGHLVVLRGRDLAYLHTHPRDGGAGNVIAFDVAFPSRDRFGLFLQFRHDGVRTAAFALGASAGGQHGAHSGH